MLTRWRRHLLCALSRMSAPTLMPHPCGVPVLVLMLSSNSLFLSFCLSLTSLSLSLSKFSLLFSSKQNKKREGGITWGREWYSSLLLPSFSYSYSSLAWSSLAIKQRLALSLSLTVWQFARPGCLFRFARWRWKICCGIQWHRLSRQIHT